MSDENISDELVRVYVSDRPRFLGVFHFGKAISGSAGAAKNAGTFGIVSHIGPCRCGNPDHTFPRWYSVTPCVYIQMMGHMVTMRVPVIVARALSWASGER